MNESKYEQLLNEVDIITRLKDQYDRLRTEVDKLSGKINHFKLESERLARESKVLKLEIDALLVAKNRVLTRGNYARELRISPKHIIPDSISEFFKVESYSIGNYIFDTKKRVLFLDGNEEYKLTSKEAYLLVLFAANINTFLDREYLLTAIWNVSNYRNSRSMDVYITKVRKMLIKDSDISIYNLHGKGYKLIVNKG